MVGRWVVYVYVYIYIYICVYVYIYVCICIYVYMCMVYVCMCACVRSAARSHWERSHRVDDTILSTGAPLYIYIYILTRVYIYLGAHVNIWARHEINAYLYRRAAPKYRRDKRDKRYIYTYIYIYIYRRDARPNIDVTRAQIYRRARPYIDVPRPNIYRRAPVDIIYRVAPRLSKSVPRPPVAPRSLSGALNLSKSVPRPPRGSSVSSTIKVPP